MFFFQSAFQSESVAGSSTAGTSAAAVATPAPAGLEPQQMQMIEQFSEKSNMLPEFSKK